LPTNSSLREFAETPDRFTEIVAGASVRRFAEDRICIVEGPNWASVSGPNVAVNDVEALVTEVRRRVPADKHVGWWIGPSAQPVDIHARLLGLGLGEPADGASLVHAMALADEPPPIAADVDVRRIEDFDDFAAARSIQWDAFSTPRPRREADQARLGEDFEESQRLGIPVWFLATHDGHPAATALAVPSARGVFLIGGATAPSARGLGLYRALVRARWDYAVERGTPALVTEALPDTSYPILRRIGFEEVCTVRRLEDLR